MHDKSSLCQFTMIALFPCVFLLRRLAALQDVQTKVILKCMIELLRIGGTLDAVWKALHALVEVTVMDPGLHEELADLRKPGPTVAWCRGRRGRNRCMGRAGRRMGPGRWGTAQQI